MPGVEAVKHPIAVQREEHGWSQAELARRSGLPRTSICAIEGRRLTPSVNAALALARTLGSTVEKMFGEPKLRSTAALEWAWSPHVEPCRYWKAEVSGRKLLFPVEAISLNGIPHDGVSLKGKCNERAGKMGESTIVLACCDPAAGLIAAEYARTSGFRMIVLPRGSGEALDLLARGLIHVAGLHQSTPGNPNRNVEAAHKRLGKSVHFIRAAFWEEGLAVPSDGKPRDVGSVIRNARRWALREEGSAARECLNELFQDSKPHGRCVVGHAGVAEAVRGGWADAGICVRIAAEEAHLDFLSIRREMLDFCFTESQARDPRVLALIRLLRSRAYREMLSELPGYDARETGQTFAS